MQNATPLLLEGILLKTRGTNWKFRFAVHCIPQGIFKLVSFLLQDTPLTSVLHEWAQNLVIIYTPSHHLEPQYFTVFIALRY